jgi:8-oxo-dGTP diphosphatase
MNPTIPEFGAAVPGCTYVLRPGSYAVLRGDAGCIAILLTPLGGFLPGGGQEPGESPEQALRREAIEECGFEVQVGERIGLVDELVFSREESCYFRKRGIFFKAQRRDGKPVVEVEPEHQLVWLPAAEAISRLSHESHKWAVRAVLAGPCAALSPDAERSG